MNRDRRPSATPPVLAHWRRAIGRYWTRLGGQFAAAITYFSVLSMTPILMVAFAAVGLTVTVFAPDLLETIKATITDLVASDPALGDDLSAAVEQAFASWQVVGGIGLASALWSGSVWVGNLRLAMRAQFREDLDDISAEPHPVLGVLENIAMLFGLLLLLGVVATLATAATVARGLIHDLLRLPDTPLSGWLLSLVPLAGTLVASFLLFWFIFRVLFRGPVRNRLRLQASGLGAVGMTALQFATGALVSLSSGTPTTAVFGSVIVLMLFFNLFASLVILLAAWMATAEAPVVEPAFRVAQPGDERPTSDYETKLLEARLRDDAERVPASDAAARVKQAWGTGVAAGSAVAGVAATLLAARPRRRPRTP